MGQTSFIFGYVEEGFVGSPNSEAVRKHNDCVLQALPELDEWPPLCRLMFGWPPAQLDQAGYAMIDYRTRLIHFACSLKQVDMCFRLWLDKFEGLLKRMYWETAFVRFISAYIGDYDFTWKIDSDWLVKIWRGQLSPMTRWEFTSTMDAKELDSLRNPNA